MNTLNTNQPISETNTVDIDHVNNRNSNRNSSRNSERDNSRVYDDNDIIRLHTVTYSRFLDGQQELLGRVLTQIANLSQQYYNISTDIMRHTRNLRTRNNLFDRTAVRNDLFMPFSASNPPPLMTPLRNYRPIARTRNSTRRARRFNAFPNRNNAQSPMIGRALYSAPISFTPFASSRLTTNQILDNTTNLTFEEAQRRNANMCPISHENFDSSSNIVMINHCGHVFARNNLYRWFETHSSCPICRHDLLNTSTQQTSERLGQSTGTQTNAQTNAQINTQTTNGPGGSQRGFQATIDISPINIFNDDVLNSFTNTIANSVVNSLSSLTNSDASNNLFANNIFSDTSEFSMPLFNSSTRTANNENSTQPQTQSNTIDEEINNTNQNNENDSDTQAGDDILNDEFENFNFND